jgi:4-amino-4-deoxy-L-arabinose transferase-like glycosyltransferase
MSTIFALLEGRIRARLSHWPKTYALIVGIGIVLFWRGVWHTADLVHTYFNYFQNNLTIDSVEYPWWDGPWSFVVGLLMLYFTGAFTSSFIGNELILSGLRGEKKLNQKTELEIESEFLAIADMKKGLKDMTLKLDQLEEKIQSSHHMK